MKECYRAKASAKEWNAKSPFLRLEYFDLINDFPLDPMHLFHIGLTPNMYIP